MIPSSFRYEVLQKCCRVKTSQEHGSSFDIFRSAKRTLFWTSMNRISEIKRESKAEEGANIINLNPAQMQIGQPKLSLNC